MRRVLLTAVAALALFGAACGGESDDDNDAASDAGTRTVRVAMVDTVFEPTSLDVDRGETIRFVFTNNGSVAHDAFIGDATAQAEHESAMRDEGGHAGHDGDDDAVTVEPGKTGELTYTFDETGTFEVGCHQPGHYAGGMKIAVRVS